MGQALNGDAPAGSLEQLSFNLFIGARSIEQQAAIVLTHLQRKETEFNRANPAETPKDRVSLGVDYDTGTLSASVDLLMIPGAVQVSLVDAIQPHLPGGTTPV